MGSALVAAWVAHVAFWTLLIFGVVVGELRVRGAVLFLVLWSVGRVGFQVVPYEPVQAMFSSFVAVLDIALVFAVFKGDVRLT